MWELYGFYKCWVLLKRQKLELHGRHVKIMVTGMLLNNFLSNEVEPDQVFTVGGEFG
jgi:hypothetical protein